MHAGNEPRQEKEQMRENAEMLEHVPPPADDPTPVPQPEIRTDLIFPYWEEDGMRYHMNDYIREQKEKDRLKEPPKPKRPDKGDFDKC